MHGRFKMVICIIACFFCLLTCGKKAGNEQDLVKAVNEGNLSEVTRLLEGGVSANAVDADSVPVLLFSIRQRQEDIAIKLLEHGASANIKDPEGKAILCLALRGSMFFASAELVRHGADFNVRCGYLSTEKVSVFAFSIGIKKMSPFKIAAKECKIDLIKSICERINQGVLSDADLQDFSIDAVSAISNKGLCIEVSDYLSEFECGI